MTGANRNMRLRAGMKVRITEGHGDTNGATGTLIRTGARAQWWVELDPAWSHLRPNGLTWVWDSEMEVRLNVSTSQRE